MDCRTGLTGSEYSDDSDNSTQDEVDVVRLGSWLPRLSRMFSFVAGHTL